MNRYIAQLSQLTLLLLSIVSSAQLHAASIRPFNLEEFERLSAEGQNILIDVRADWCTSCLLQKKALTEWVYLHPDRNLTIFDVNFDTQKDLVVRFSAPRHSTLILYKGDNLIWISVAETRKERIFLALDEATAH
ncbi:MAG: thioredoxin 1 [Flavobacteriales bacterium]|jgi:thioredoxin 1